MTFGSLPFAESTLAGTALVPLAVVEEPGPEPPIGGPAEVPLVIDPFSVVINGVTYKPLIDSLSIDMDASRQGTASFTLSNITTMVRIGQPVTITFYDEVIFAGSLDRVKLRSNNLQTYKVYECECVDFSYLLMRKKISRTYTNASVPTITFDVIANYLGGEGVSLGSFSSGLPLPSVSADNVSIYDLLREASQSLGMLFYIDFNRQIHFKGAIADPAPMTLDENVIEDCQVLFDREGYRNYQVVTVTGTPSASGGGAVTVSYTATNGAQISEQASIENGNEFNLGNGVYREQESITHPTSNDPGTLTKLAVATAKALLAVSGEMRQTISIKTRQYGFKAGQVATVSVPHLGITGEWIIQRVGLRDESGRWLVTDMELSRTSLRQLQYQLWLDIARKGSITVVPPTAAITQSQTFSTPGVTTFTVPAGITTVQVTCVAAGGGGGGPAQSLFLAHTAKYSLGGTGGRGGKVISVISVNPGQVLTITVPSGGFGGIGQQQIGQTIDAVGSNGGDGGNAKVAIGGAVHAEAYGGIGGIGARANAFTGLSGIWAPSPDGAGAGQTITVGGGAIGGVSGLANPLQNSQAGSNGSVLVEW
jgi:hypothetical protein